MEPIFEPSVYLLDYTGMGMIDPNWAAKKLVYTKRTRLKQSPETYGDTFLLEGDELKKELSYVANSVRSSWEFVSFTFQICNVSRAFTHQLVRTRTCSYAQQSQRSINMEGFDFVVPEAIREHPEAYEDYVTAMDTINLMYGDQLSHGMSQQNARALLPTNVATNIVMEVNLRTLADLAIKRDNLRAQGEYVDVFRGMVEKALEVMPWIEEFLYPERTSTPALEQILQEIRGDDCPVDNEVLNDALKELDKMKKAWG